MYMFNKIVCSKQFDKNTRVAKTLRDLLEIIFGEGFSNIAIFLAASRCKNISELISKGISLDEIESRIADEIERNGHYNVHPSNMHLFEGYGICKMDAQDQKRFTDWEDYNRVYPRIGSHIGLYLYRQSEIIAKIRLDEFYLTPDNLWKKGTILAHISCEEGVHLIESLSEYTHANSKTMFLKNLNEMNGDYEKHSRKLAELLLKAMNRVFSHSGLAKDLFIDLGDGYSIMNFDPSITFPEWEEFIFKDN